MDFEDKDTELKNQTDQTEPQEQEQEDEYEDVCFMCHRPASKAGKMIHLAKDIHICAECMQKAMDTMNKGNVDYSKIDFSKMPNISMINLSDLQNMIPHRQRVKMKAAEQNEQRKLEKRLGVQWIPARLWI
ncbi:MAG: ClpX C4-type zinc finger protein [Lachnospiraceae bacterium]|nr:ClpX C4-type zinc finger protein [Lachnospiraceae bacterium]